MCYQSEIGVKRMPYGCNGRVAGHDLHSQNTADQHALINLNSGGSRNGKSWGGIEVGP